MEKDISKLLKGYRKEACLTQEQVAEKINVSRNTYTQYENGSRRIDIETFIDITEALGVQISIRDWQNIEKKIKDLQNMKKEWKDLRDEFFKAIYEFDTIKAKEMLEAGLDSDIRDEDGERAFIAAIDYGASEIVKLLLKYGTSYKSEYDYEFEDEWERPLTLATENGFYGVVKVLLDFGICPNDNIEYGPTPIQEACIREKYDLVRLLKSYGADFNIKWYNGNIVSRLIEKKSDNMLIYLKEKCYNQLNQEQRKQLDEYIEEWRPHPRYFSDELGRFLL